MIMIIRVMMMIMMLGNPDIFFQFSSKKSIISSSLISDFDLGIFKQKNSFIFRYRPWHNCFGIQILTLAFLVFFLNRFLVLYSDNDPGATVSEFNLGISSFRLRSVHGQGWCRWKTNKNQIWKDSNQSLISGISALSSWLLLYLSHSPRINL